MTILRPCRRAGFDGRDHGFRSVGTLSVTLLFLFLILPQSAVASDPIRIALLPSGPINGKLDVSAELLDSVLLGEVEEQSGVVPIAPERVAKFIAETPNRSCADLACQLALGKEVGADHVFSLSGIYMGRALLLELRSVDTKTQRVEQMQRLTYTGPVDSVQHAFGELVRDLLGTITSRKVWLAIRTEPVGASIELNGRPQGISPLLLEVDPTNPVFLAAQLGVMRTEGEVTSFHKDTLSVLMVLQQAGERRQFGLFGSTRARFSLIGGVTMIKMAVRYDQPAFMAAQVDYGTQWRLGFGVFQNRQVIPGTSALEIEELGIAGEPQGNALGGYALIGLSPPLKRISPILAVGVVGMQRTVEISYIDGNVAESYEEFSMGGMVRVGFEVKLPWHLRAGIIFNDMFLLDDSTVSNDFQGMQRDVWDEAFEKFDSVTSLNFTLGIEF